MVRQRSLKNMRGGESLSVGTIPLETKSYSNGATDPSEDAANAASASNDKLTELNNLMGGAYRHRVRRLKMRGGEGGDLSGQIKAITVDSPIREVVTGEFSTSNQITQNQQAINQGVADTKYDNIQGGGLPKRKRGVRKSRKLLTRRKSKYNGSKRARKTVKKRGSRTTRSRVTRRP